MDIKIIAAGTDLGLLDHLESRLTRCGYRVGKVSSVSDLLRQLVHYEPSLIILIDGRRSPAWSAEEACQRVRQVSRALMLAITDETKLTRMLRLGVDDCVKRPIQWEILVARVEALLRRASKPAQRGYPPAILAEADFWINFDTQEVKVRGKDLTLSNKEFRLLAHLARNQGHVVPIAQLLGLIGDGHSEARRGSLRQYICQLRRKMERDPSSPEAILTHRRLGYSLDVHGL